MNKNDIQDALCLFGFLLPFEKEISFPEWSKLIGISDPRAAWFSDKIGEMKASIQRSYQGTAKVIYHNV